MIDAFVDPLIFAVTIPPLLIACIAMNLGAGVQWSVTLRDIGVPMGLLMSFVGFVGVAANMSDPSLLGPITATLLLALLYGGILASVGYFWGFRSEGVVKLSLGPGEVNWWAPSVSIIALLATIIFSMNEAAGLKHFFSPLPLTMFAVVALVALRISKQKNVLQALSQSFLLGAMLNVLIGLVSYFQGNRLGLEIALLGITYAFIAYICLYFLSFKIGDPKKLDAPLMNWHWLEVSGFIIFMFLSPASLKEEMLNIESDEVEKQIELRIQALERKLDLLSHQTTQ